jgi:hypothetical protein
MTREDLLDRLNQIGELWVQADPGDDLQAFQERGIALGVALGIVGTIDARLLEDLVELVTEEARRADPRVH